MALQRSTSVHVHTCLTPWVVLLASSGLVTVKIHSLPAIVLLVVIALSFVFQVHSEQCSNEISLRARFGKTSYARWTNTSTTLICSGAGFTSIMWYSVRTVYKMAVGCLKNEHEELHLDWFPDVPEIIATYISYQRRIRQVCIFSSSNGILSANLSQENLDDNLSNVPVTATLYFPKNSLITNVFFICKQGEVRNGTCRSQMSNGTFYNGEKSIYTNDEFYKITYEVVPTHMGKHECFARINGLTTWCL
ncbi:unnamed protein product [Heterobilharzia americana]|nr:unnamed protein product [Heterobilharzia americana]